VKKALACIALLVTLLSSSTALAAETQPNAISYEPLAITSRGLLLQYERLVLPRLSVVGGVGARFAARDDFSSWTLILKSEARFWLAGREALSDTQGMVGTYLALSLAGSRTELEHRASGRTIGAMWDVEETIRFGYRFVVFGFQEITPSVGIGMVHEIDERGRLAPATRATYLSFGLTVGWMF
jgi:hypothetical protein